MTPGAGAGVIGQGVAPSDADAQATATVPVLPWHTSPGRAGIALGRCALGLVRSIAGLLLALVAVASFALWFGLGMFPLFTSVTALIRRVANAARARAGRWSDVAIAVPYRPRPRLEQTEHGWYWSGHDYHKHRWFAAISLRMRWLSSDPATWRDLAWVFADPVVGGAILGVPVLLAVAGLWSLLAGSGVGVVHGALATHASQSPGVATACVLVAVVLLGAAYGAAAFAVSLHGRWTALLLKPGRPRLSLRVEQLTRTRADATADQAAELRRIERDVHDGAQAKLVAMRMKLATLSVVVDNDPVAAKQLVADLQDTAARALQELRDLVHGIHPPVLAERGIGDAVRAFVLDLPLDAQVEVDLPGRFEPAVETAAYFALCEALTNVVKHAGTRDVTVTAGYDAGRLHAAVVDEGRGGADLSAGSGLRGIERRLAALDATLGVVSSPGGPTRISLEIPCASCSPKTSTSSGTG